MNLIDNHNLLIAIYGTEGYLYRNDGELATACKLYALRHGYKLESRLTNGLQGACTVKRFGKHETEKYAKNENKAIIEATKWVYERVKNVVDYEYLIKYRLDCDEDFRASKRYYESVEEFLCSNSEVVEAELDLESKREKSL